MFPRVFTILSALSLLLCVTMAVLWARSYQATTKLEFQRSGTLWEVASEHGRLRLDNAQQRNMESARASRERAALMHECFTLNRQQIELLTRIRHASADERRELKAERSRLQALSDANGKARAAIFHKPLYTTALIEHSVPHAAVVAPAAAVPGLWVGLAIRRSLRRRKARINQLCAHCGYDLRATPERCPECGMVASNSK